MGTKYDEVIVIQQVRHCIPRCRNIQEAADELQIPRSTLRGILKRQGYKNYSDLVATVAEESTTLVPSLQMQVKHWKKVATRYEKQLADRRWLHEEIAGLVAVQEPVKVPCLKSTSVMSEQIPVLEFSDPHFGLKVPEGQLGVFGTFDSQIAEARSLHTFRTFASIAKSQQFPVRKAVVLSLGDLVEHSYMRPAQAKQTDAHVIKQSIHCAEVLTKCLQFLCGEFEEVEVHAVPGNHGRTTQKAGENLPDETYDHLIYHMVRLGLARQQNFKINICESWYFITEILGWKFLGLHCEDALSWAGIPFYGIERLVKNYYMMLGQVTLEKLRALDPTTELAISEFLRLLLLPDYVTIGHFHNPMMWQIMGVELLANGALSGVSVYGAKRLKKSSPPKQQMFFVHRQHGVGLRCPINLSKIG